MMCRVVVYISGSVILKLLSDNDLWEPGDIDVFYDNKQDRTSVIDFETYLKAEFLDSVYLQQNAFDEVDAACSLERQLHVFTKVHEVLTKKFAFEQKSQTREFFHQLRQTFIDWNFIADDTDEFKSQEKKIDGLIEEHSK